MSAALALGLLAALLYGATDFVARFAGRSVGPLRAILHGHAAAALALARSCRGEACRLPAP